MRLNYSAHHALVGNNADCEVVDTHSVILATHDFRSHIARSARGFLGVVRAPDPGDAEVSEAQVATLVKDEVFRLDVSVKDAFLVDVL